MIAPHVDPKVIKQVERLPSMQRKFVLEHWGGLNQTEAAAKAGYKNPDVAAAKLMKMPIIRRALHNLQKDDVQRLQLSRDLILEQLLFYVSWTSDDFIDERGDLKPLHLLPERAKNAINGIKVKKRILYGADGPEGEEITTEVKMVPKERAADMIMKHFGLYAAEKHEIEQSININWEDLANIARQGKDEIEQRLEEERIRLLERKEQHKQLAIEAEYTVKELLDDEEDTVHAEG